MESKGNAETKIMMKKLMTKKMTRRKKLITLSVSMCSSNMYTLAMHLITSLCSLWMALILTLLGAMELKLAS